MDENPYNVEADKSAVERRRTMGTVVLIVAVNTYLLVLFNNLKAVGEWLDERFEVPWAELLAMTLVGMVPIAILFGGAALLRSVLKIPAARKAEYDRAAWGRIAGLANCAFWGVVIAIGLVLTEPRERQ